MIMYILEKQEKSSFLYGYFSMELNKWIKFLARYLDRVHSNAYVFMNNFIWKEQKNVQKLLKLKNFVCSYNFEQYCI